MIELTSFNRKLIAKWCLCNVTKKNSKMIVLAVPKEEIILGF